MVNTVYRSLIRLFWTPYMALFDVKYRVSKVLGWVIFDYGFITPGIYKLYRKFIRMWKHDAVSILNYLFSSIGSKGDVVMARIYGLHPDRIQEFEPKGQDDIPQEERTVFLCKFLDVKLSASIADNVYSAKGFGNKREELLRAGTQEVEILRKGLVGWKNFYYDEETEVEWEDVPHNLSKQKRENLMDRNLNKIAPELRGEIADFVRGSSTPDQD